MAAVPHVLRLEVLLFFGFDQVFGEDFGLPGEGLGAFQIAGGQGGFGLIEELADL